MLRRLWIAVLVGILAAPLLVMYLSARATAGPAVINVLLLGDSYISGNGARLGSGQRAFYGPEDCFRSSANWGEKWAGWLQSREAAAGRQVVVKVTNHACSGATAERDFLRVREPWPSPQDTADYTVSVSLPSGAAQTPQEAKRAIERSYPCETDTFSKGVTRTLTGVRFTSRRVATAHCRVTYQNQVELAGAGQWDVVLLSLGGNDLDFGRIVTSCFIPKYPFLEGKNDRLCQERLDAIDPARPGSRMSTVFGTGPSDYGRVGEVFQRLLPRLRSGVPVVYVGYPGLEIDPDYAFHNSGPVGRRIADGAAHLRQRQQGLVQHFTSPRNPIVYVPLVERFRCHENTGRNAVWSRPNPADCRGRDSAAWMWDAPENPSVLYDGKGVLPGLIYDGPNWMGLRPHYRSEFYHYNPQGHQAVFEAVRDATGNLVIPTSSAWTGAQPQVAMGSRIGRPGACNPLRIPGVVAPDLQASVRLADGRVIDAAAPGACIPGDATTGQLTIRVASRLAGVDHTYAQEYLVTDDGDAVAAQVDNCPTKPNPDQHDLNANGIGDACDDSANRPADPSWPPSRIFGSSHLVTLDGQGFDMQPVGEFTLLRLPAEQVEVQGRFAPFRHPDASLASAYAIRDGYETVEMRCERSGVTALRNGQPLAVGEVARLRGSQVSIENGRLVLRTYSGVMLAVDQQCGLGLAVAPGLETVGMLGNNDQDPGNDLTAADGKRVVAADSEALHTWFVDSWRVSDQSSLFTYEAGMSTASYTDRSARKR